MPVPDSSFLVNGFDTRQALEGPYDAQLANERIQSAQQANTLGKIHINEEQLKANEMQQDKQDQDTLQREIANPDYQDNGKFSWDKFRAGIQDKVRFRTLQQIDEEHRRAQQAMMAQSQEQRNQYKFHNEQIGSAIDYLYGLPADQRKAALPKVLDGLKAHGIEGVDDYYSLDPSDQNLQALARRHEYLKELLNPEQQKAKAEWDTARAKRGVAQAKMEDEKDAEAKRQQMRENAAQSYLAVQNQAQHDQWLKSLPPEIAPQYANLTTFGDASQKAVEEMAQTSEQRARNRIYGTDKNITPMEAAIAYARGKLPNGTQDQVYDLALKRLGEMQKDAKFAPNTAGGKVDRQQQKEWMTQYDKAANEEANYYPAIRKLEQAVQSGANYVDEKGKSVPMDQYVSKADDKEAAKKAAIESMRQQADELRDKAANAIGRKYDVAGRLGFGGDVARDQAIQSVQAGKYSKPAQQSKPGTLGGAVAPQQPAAAPSAPARKTYTEQDIRAWAQKNGRDPEAAVQAARAKKLIP